MQVVCGHCGKGIQADPDPSGQMDCPHCGEAIRLPSTDPSKSVSGAKALREVEGYAAVARSVRHKRIDFLCTGCRKRLGAPLENAGRSVACPHCGTTLVVPQLDSGPDPSARPSRKARRAASRAKAASAAAARRSNGARAAAAGEPTTPALSVRTVATVAAVVVGVGLVIGAALLIMNVLDGSDSGGAGRVADVIDPDGSAQPGQSSPATEPADAGAAEPGPAVEAAGPVACEVVQVRRDVFANAGYLAAPLASVYVKVTVRIDPDQRTVAFNTYGDAVVLSIGGQDYEALGALSGCSVFPLTGVRVPASVGAGQPREVRFLFEVPRSVVDVGATPASVAIERVGSVGVTIPAPDETPTPTALAGEYVESLPRNLRDGSTSELSELIRTHNRHHLSIRAGADDVRAALPDVGLAGRCESSDGHYAIHLVRGPAKADMALRVAPNKRLVLYVTPEPFGQLAFAPAGMADALMMLPLYNDNTDEPWAVGKPKRVTPPKPKEAPQPWRPPRRRGPDTIFDF